MAGPLDSLNDNSMTGFCLRYWYRRIALMVLVVSAFGILVMLFFPDFLPIYGSLLVIVIIIYIEGRRSILSNVESNTKRRHVLQMMLTELYSIHSRLERGSRLVYEDGQGTVGFVNGVFAYDWCDRLAIHSGASFDVIISQMKIHDIVNLAKDHNYYRQKLEDAIVPNRTNGVLIEKHAKYVRSYCEILQAREIELARILPDVIIKGKKLIESIGINICKRPDSISA